MNMEVEATDEKVHLCLFLLLRQVLWGPVCAHLFYLKIVEDDVKRSSTKTYCTLQLVKCYASARQNQLGFGLLSLVEAMSSDDGRLRLSVQFPYHF